MDCFDSEVVFVVVLNRLILFVCVVGRRAMQRGSPLVVVDGGTGETTSLACELMWFHPSGRGGFIIVCFI